MSRPENRITVLPPAGRDEQLERWGVGREYVGHAHGYRGHQAEDAIVDADTDEADEHELEARGFLMEGGWRLAQAGKGRVRQVDDGGMTSHRGVLHPDEHVNADALRSAVEDALGFTYDEVRSVYRQGPKSATQLELRARIDARLLELAAAGGLMVELGRALDFPVKDDGHCRVIENALARARKEASA